MASGFVPGENSLIVPNLRDSPAGVRFFKVVNVAADFSALAAKGGNSPNLGADPD
jgi:hypothetical protein